MDIKSALDYIYNLKSFRRRETLERIEKLLSILGNPEKKFKSIHVAGTNGKGSVSTFIYSVLKEAGFNTALYTSPHLIKFNERIKVQDEDISDSELIRLAEFIMEKASGLDITFFEFTTALAFLYFAEKKVDFAVIEVGLGGRLDATNTISPLLSVITHIEIDHQEQLGTELLQIAREKAGIIKQGIPLVTAEDNPEVLKLFDSTCKQKNSQIFILNKDLSFKKKADRNFSTSGLIKDEFSTSMLGDYQLENASTALLAIYVLNTKYNYNISTDKIKLGIKKALIHGRLEKIDNILLDGAHNPDAMRSLAEYIKDIDKDIVLILGIKKGKNIEKISSIIAPLASKIILTKSSFKASPLNTIAREVKKYNKNVFKTANPKQALELASKSEDSIILVTGSLYLVGDILSLLSKSNRD
jgi:dihydrofolate synthase/folylpolyglutamate synthase